MLTKEKLSEITKQAIGTFHYTYAVAKVSSQNSFAIRLYDAISEELVANSFIYEGDKPGWFTVDFVPERSNKTDREVLRDIISQLYEYFDEQLKQKYYIKLLNTDYGYLTRVEGTDSWSITSLKIAKMSNQKATFTASEINEIAQSDLCTALNPMDLLRAAEEVEED
ncbi:hypothetical protein LBLM1_02925 [Limosilactobacillus mucosae LM1]|uniref:Uncharacterized protein n=1 Tax=Limosilactobacillus mucosae LM1 TaxID=1130798 RepID=A0A0D4CJT5_LIMMU|nr:hypothetical protein [Limosilactobacillus mucosae]AJT50126.1 hypothetical protein LBLM1_02925 [Limosilactobacillus mucosae LM1]